MAVRKANAVWKGTLKEGSGNLSVQLKLIRCSAPLHLIKP
jgi:hypothetical protein